MTPEAQRIAIAEACGWKWDLTSDRRTYWFIPGGIVSRDMNDKPFPCDPPDFLNNLNAMAYAEKTLSDEQQHMYALILSQEHWQNPDSGWTDWRDTRAIIVLSAAQRAEAFLRALNLWK